MKQKLAPTKANKSALPASDEVFDSDVLAELENSLSIDRDALESELLSQANDFWHVGERLALWTSRRDAAKQQQQLVEAEVDAQIRHDAAVAEEKITEREVESQKRVSKRVRAAQDDLLRYNHTVARFANLKEAYQQRSYVLKELVALYLANYYATNSVSGGDSSMMKQQLADRNKEAMHRERQRVRGR